MILILYWSFQCIQTIFCDTIETKLNGTNSQCTWWCLKFLCDNILPEVCSNEFKWIRHEKLCLCGGISPSFFSKYWIKSNRLKQLLLKTYDRLEKVGRPYYTNLPLGDRFYRAVFMRKHVQRFNTPVYLLWTISS